MLVCSLLVPHWLITCLQTALIYLNFWVYPKKLAATALLGRKQLQRTSMETDTEVTYGLQSSEQQAKTCKKASTQKNEMKY